MSWAGGARVGANRLASARALPAAGSAQNRLSPADADQYMWTHTHTHAACTHHMHTQAHKQTNIKTDTRIPMCAHTHTQAHIYLCGLVGSQTRLHANMCRRTRHTQGWKHHPHLIVRSSTLKGLSCPRVGPHLLILQTSENQAPLGHNHFCFPQKELPPNLWSLRAQRPKTLMVLCWAGLSRDIGGHQVTSLRHLEASFPPN